MVEMDFGMHGDNDDDDDSDYDDNDDVKTSNGRT